MIRILNPWTRPVSEYVRVPVYQHEDEEGSTPVVQTVSEGINVSLLDNPSDMDEGLELLNLCFLSLHTELFAYFFIFIFAKNFLPASSKNISSLMLEIPAPNSIFFLINKEIKINSFIN